MRHLVYEAVARLAACSHQSFPQPPKLVDELTEAFEDRL
jgi:hypothetical protein